MRTRYDFPHFVPRANRWRGGFLYLIGLADGAVKVGRSGNLVKRMEHHRRTFGDAIAWTHIFPQEGCGAAEIKVIAAFAQIAERVGKTEVFRGIGKQQAVEVARALVNDRLLSEAQKAEQAFRERVGREHNRLLTGVAKEAERRVRANLDLPAPEPTQQAA